MRIVGAAAMAGLLIAGSAGAQTIIRTGPPGVIVASDIGGPYDEEALPPRYARPVYDPRAYSPPPPPPVYGPAAYGPPVLPVQEIYRIVREGGFSPLGAPQQRGAVYTIAVLDLDGEDGRLVIDARSGRIIRFMPAYRFGARGPGDVGVAYGAPGVAAPPVMAHPKAGVPLPKPRLAAVQAAPDKTVAVAAPKPVVPPAPPAAIAAAQPAATAIAPFASKPAFAPQPSGLLPAAQGLD